MSTISKEISTAALYEGTFSVGLDKKFNRINREDPPAKGALKISLNPFLIKTEARNYLFDTGIGGFGEDTSTATIIKNLDKQGLGADDITDIFASHLHYDHIGGLAGFQDGSWSLTFPKANLWVSRKGWEKAMNLDEYYDEEKTVFLHFLNEHANLQFLDEEDQPYPEITVHQIGGHTEFSQALFFEDGPHKYLMAGDVLANRGEVNRKFAAKYDYAPKISMQVRQKLTHKAYEKEFTIMGYHDSQHPLFRLTDFDKRNGYTITPEDTDVSS